MNSLYELCKDFLNVFKCKQSSKDDSSTRALPKQCLCCRVSVKTIQTRQNKVRIQHRMIFTIDLAFMSHK